MTKFTTNKKKKTLERIKKKIYLASDVFTAYFKKFISQLDLQRWIGFEHMVYCIMLCLYKYLPYFINTVCL